MLSTVFWTDSEWSRLLADSSIDAKLFFCSVNATSDRQGYPSRLELAQLPGSTQPNAQSHVDYQSDWRANFDSVSVDVYPASIDFFFLIFLGGTRVELWQKLAGHRIPLTQADRLVPMLRFFALMCCALYPARMDSLVTR